MLAFRKVSGLRAHVDAPTARSCAAWRAAAAASSVRFPNHGKHIEADLSRQVIALIRGSRVERIYPTSSGSPATPTVRGSFRFYMSQPGYNAKEMFYSKYFIGGYAIHGYKSVPVVPGVARLPARADPRRAVDLRLDPPRRPHRRLRYA